MSVKRLEERVVIFDAVVVQLVERVLAKDQVMGPSPIYRFFRQI